MVFFTLLKLTNPSSQEHTYLDYSHVKFFAKVLVQCLISQLVHELSDKALHLDFQKFAMELSVRSYWINFSELLNISTIIERWF